MEKLILHLSVGGMVKLFGLAILMSSQATHNTVFGVSSYDTYSDPRLASLFLLRYLNDYLGSSTLVGVA